MRYPYRVVVDDNVDRLQVYSRWRHSRAILITRTFTLSGDYFHWLSVVVKQSLRSIGIKKLKGVYGKGDPPLPIPNREVKPFSADGTADRWESRKMPNLDGESNRDVTLSFFVLSFVSRRFFSSLFVSFRLVCCVHSVFFFVMCCFGFFLSFLCFLLFSPWLCFFFFCLLSVAFSALCSLRCSVSSLFYFFFCPFFFLFLFSLVVVLCCLLALPVSACLIFLSLFIFFFLCLCLLDTVCLFAFKPVLLWY